MKKFLSNLIVFFGLFLGSIVCLLSIYCVKVRNMSFKISPETKILFVGDSQIEVGVDQNLIPGVYNFAKSGENYVNIFLRTKTLLEANPQIKTVFVTASPSSISSYADSRIFSDFSMQNNFGNNFPLYSFSEWELFFEYDFRMTLKYTFQPLRLANKIFRRNEKAQIMAMGCQAVSKGKNLKSNIEKGIDGMKRKYVGDNLSITYLKKLVALSQERGVRIIFLNAPTYKAKEYFDMTYFRKRLFENFPDVEFWDYSAFPIPDDCRQDIGHLNKWGAEIFSKELAARMKREGIIKE